MDITLDECKSLILDGLGQQTQILISIQQYTYRWFGSLHKSSLSTNPSVGFIFMKKMQKSGQKYKKI